MSHGAALAVATLTILISGCTQMSAPEPDAEQALRAPVTTGGHVSLVAAHPHDEYPSQQVALDVPPEARSLLLEAKWSCTTPDCLFSLRLVRQADGITVATSDVGTAEARLVIMAPEAGPFFVRLGSNMFSVGMAGEIRVTAFFSFGEPPAGYTAFA